MKRMMFAAAAAVSLFAAPATAATYILDLTGSVASGSTATVDSGGFRFNFFTIALSGFAPTTFEVGDEVKATITLDAPLTVPTGSVRNAVDLVLLNTSYPGVTTDTSGTTDLFLSAAAVMSGASGSSSSDALFNSLLNFSGTSFTFDAAQSDFIVTSLGAASLATDTAYFRWISVDALAPEVPEPATWAMLIVGFGMIGAAIRRPTQRVRPRAA